MLRLSMHSFCFDLSSSSRARLPSRCNEGQSSLNLTAAPVHQLTSLCLVPRPSLSPRLQRRRCSALSGELGVRAWSLRRVRGFRTEAMDVRTLDLAGGGPVQASRTSPRRATVVARRRAFLRLPRVEGEANGAGFGEFNVSMRRRRCRSLEARATGRKKDNDSSSSGSNDPSNAGRDSSDDTNPAFDNSKLNDATEKSNSLMDWRDFRADLVAREQVLLVDSDASSQITASHEPIQRFGKKWAHPIPMPETGCVLVATEKLDGVRNFERSVVLLLRLGTRDPREGPFGVIINRPLHKKIKHMKPSNSDLATTFADCPLHYGGPLDASMYLLNVGENQPIQGFEKVVPGICFGARNNLDVASELVNKGVLGPQDFRFFVGYAGWQLDQLLEEIESDYWVVAACSSSLISGASSDSSHLWEEILQLMGGRYLELSRKPKQDSS